MYRSRLRIVNIYCVLHCFKRQSSIVPRRCIYRGKGGGISVFTTPQSADVFVASLHEEERLLLREALRIHDQADEDTGSMKWAYTDPKNMSYYSMDHFFALHNVVRGLCVCINMSIIILFFLSSFYSIGKENSNPPSVKQLRLGNVTSSVDNVQNGWFPCSYKQPWINKKLYQLVHKLYVHEWGMVYQKGQVPLKMKGVTVPLWLVGQSLLCHCKRRLYQLFELLLVPHTHIRNLLVSYAVPQTSQIKASLYILLWRFTNGFWGVVVLLRFFFLLWMIGWWLSILATFVSSL